MAVSPTASSQTVVGVREARALCANRVLEGAVSCNNPPSPAGHSGTPRCEVRARCSASHAGLSMERTVPHAIGELADKLAWGRHSTVTTTIKMQRESS